METTSVHSGTINKVATPEYMEGKMFVCQKCHREFLPEQDDDEFEFSQTKLCYECFEASLEDYEERRRERIARQNEY